MEPPGQDCDEPPKAAAVPMARSSARLASMLVEIVDHLDAMIAYWNADRLCTFAQNNRRQRYAELVRQHFTCRQRFPACRDRFAVQGFNPCENGHSTLSSSR